MRQLFYIDNSLIFAMQIFSDSSLKTKETFSCWVVAAKCLAVFPSQETRRTSKMGLAGALTNLGMPSPPNQSGVGRVKPMINQDIEDGVSRFFLTLFKGGGVQTHNQKNCCKFVEAIWHRQVIILYSSKWNGCLDDDKHKQKDKRW